LNESSHITKVTLTPKQLRDWRANFVVAGLDTLAADLTAQLVGAKLLPIYWLPRKHVLTGELAIVLLSDGHKFGGGFRRCAGEHVAREMVRLVLRRFQVQLLPDESDLRPVGLITQRLAKVVGVMTRKDGGL
jgi:cytochrome P450